MKTILAAFMVLGMVFSIGMATVAHASVNAEELTTVTGNTAG